MATNRQAEFAALPAEVQELILMHLYDAVWWNRFVADMGDEAFCQSLGRIQVLFDKHGMEYAENKETP